MAVKPTQQKPGTKLIAIGAVLLGLSLLGIPALITLRLMSFLLGNPAEGTTAMIVVNISTFAVAVVSLLLAMSLAIIGIIKNAKRKK